ncbi:MAG: phosphate ABC transporter ATP-binding protein [Anaerolineales bacterium]
MTAPLYRVRDLKKTYQARTVLDVPALAVREGELLAVVGPSGAGKSTLLRVLHFLEKPTSGQIGYCGQPVTDPVPLSQRREVSMVFQRPEMIDGTVWDNVEFGLRLRGIADPGRVAGALKRVDLLPLKDAAVHTLSSGETQRVALARVMVLSPHVILLDEPTANLDPHNVALVEKIIRNLHRESGATIVLVTHNVFQARRLADRVGFLLGGHLVEVSPTEQFFQSPIDPRSLAFVRGEMVY